MAEVGMVASVSGRIRDVQSWLGQLTEAAALTEWGALFACVLLAWLLVWLLRRALRADRPDLGVLVPNA